MLPFPPRIWQSPPHHPTRGEAIHGSHLRRTPSTDPSRSIRPRPLSKKRGYSQQKAPSTPENSPTPAPILSPLQNIKPGTKYPATLITTADHDDRVVPAHSFKFAATIQAAQAGPAPVLIRIETKAGHGAGKPTSKIIEEAADRYAFLAKSLHMDDVNFAK